MSVRSSLPIASPAPTRALAEFTHSLEVGSLDVAERRAAKRHLLDSLGACVAGVDEPMVQRAATLLGELTGDGDIPVAGSARRNDLLTAIYLMAVSTHALELDDGNREGSIHPGTVVVPAALGLGYRQRVDGGTLLCAVVAGYEAAISLAEVLHPHAARRGFQTTGVVGGIGAAAAAARLLALDADTTERALGIAASSGSGLFAYLTGGGNVKKLHPAHAAREGVFAALLAQRAVVEGPCAVAETRAGVFDAFAGLAPGTAAAPARSDALAITRSYLKPYPCCRHIHPAIDGLLEMRRTQGIDPDRVAAIEVGTYEAAMPHAKLGWDSLTVAQLSFPYVMAAALRAGKIELDTFGDAARNAPTVAVDAAKVHVALDRECCAGYPKQGPARVTVVMDDGTRHSVYVADPGGCPEKPMSDEELFAKFRMMVSARFSAARADELIELVWSIETLPDVRLLLDRLGAL